MIGIPRTKLQGRRGRAGLDAPAPEPDARLRELLVQPRLLVGLALIAGGVVWAFARGLAFYGVAPIDLGYGLDQPPIVLALVGSWLLYRSRRP